MRSARFGSFVLALVALATAAAFAPPAAADVSMPPWSGETLVLRESSLPEGWKAVTGEEDLSAMKAVEDVVKPILEKEQIDELDAAHAGIVVRNAAGDTVTVFFLDLDADPKGVPAAVKAAAAEKGWHYQELGTPLRLLILTGPETARGAVLKAQLAQAVAALTMQAIQYAKTDVVSARKVLQSGLAIEPKAAAPHAVEGIILTAEATEAARKEDAEKAKGLYEQAVASFRKAFAEGTVARPTPQLAYQALSEYGLALLSLKKPEHNAEAKKVLQKAVALEEHGGPAKGNTRYNLACALSLLGEKAEAIKELDASLKALKEVLQPAAYTEFLQNHIPKDTDLDNIRNEPGFKEVLERAGSGSSGGGI